MGELRKSEYLTGKDLVSKPSVLEHNKFDYSPLGKVFTKGLSKDAQNKGLFKRLENIKGKNEEMLNELRRPNEASKTTKYESGYNYDSKDAFYKFYRDFEDFKRMASMDSKH